LHEHCTESSAQNIHAIISFLDVYIILFLCVYVPLHVLIPCRLWISSQILIHVQTIAFGVSSQIFVYIQPISFGVSSHLNLQSHSNWSLSNGTCQKRPRELHHRLTFEMEEKMQQAVLGSYCAQNIHIIISFLDVYIVLFLDVCIPLHVLIPYRIWSSCQIFVYVFVSNMIWISRI